MKYNKVIDFYISYCFESHEVKTNKDYPNSIFWVKDGKIIVEIEKQQYFWLHYQIWADISRMFELDYSETQSFIKIWLKQHLNLEELTPFAPLGIRNRQLKQHLNLEELTPVNVVSRYESLLKQHLNLEELTPLQTGPNPSMRWNNTIILDN